MYSRIQAACDIILAMFFDVLWISPLILNDMEHTLKMKKKAGAGTERLRRIK